MSVKTCQGKAAVCQGVKIPPTPDIFARYTSRKPVTLSEAGGLRVEDLKRCVKPEIEYKMCNVLSGARGHTENPKHGY